MSELQPIFTIQVWLDGDDVAANNMKNALDDLKETLYDLKRWKIIREYTIEVKS